MGRAAGRAASSQDVAVSRLGSVIKRAEQTLIGEKSRALREFDLTVPQYATLMALSCTPPPGMSGAQLARACLVTPQSMSTVLAKLETKGLIERHASQLHLKVMAVTLTPAGRALAERADVVVRAVEDRLAEAFSEPDRARLSALLERCVAALTA